MVLCDCCKKEHDRVFERTLYDGAYIFLCEECDKLKDSEIIKKMRGDKK